MEDSDCGDPNVIAIVVKAGANSTGNDVVDEKFAPGIGLERSIGCEGQ